MKKLLTVGALLGTLAAGVTGASASDPIYVDQVGGQGCISPPGDTCTYNATRTGGYVAQGSTWSIDVVLPGGATAHYDPASGAPRQGCALWPAGSTVTIRAGASSAIAAGNPFPSQSDPVLVGRNDC